MDDSTLLKHDVDDDSSSIIKTNGTAADGKDDDSSDDDNNDNDNNNNKKVDDSTTISHRCDTCIDDGNMKMILKCRQQQTKEDVGVELDKPMSNNNNNKEKEEEEKQRDEVVVDPPSTDSSTATEAAAAAAAPNNNRRRRRRRRNESEQQPLRTATATATTTIQNEQVVVAEKILLLEHQNHSLRISASNVAAMTGFHPYKILPELLMDLVYQGRNEGQILLQHDACQLQLQLLSEEEVLQQLAHKADSATVSTALQEALQIKAGTKIISTVQEADRIKQRVVQEAKKASSATSHSSSNSNNSISRAEWRLLQEGVRSAVDTGYGTMHEDDALDLYENECGWPVQERNAEIRVWPFRKSSSSSSSSSAEVAEKEKTKKEGQSTTTTDLLNRNQTAMPMADAKVLLPQREEESVVAANNEASSDELLDKNDKSTGGGGKRIKIEKTTAAKSAHEVNDEDEQQEKPYFMILGSVDGIREELVPVNSKDAEDDDDSWVMRKVIVECKHRMKQIRQVPPLYEQIQTCVYCQMYGVSEADIVQVLRRSNKESSKMQQTKFTREGAQDNSETLDKWVVRTGDRPEAGNVVTVPDKEVPPPEASKASQPKPEIYFTRVSLDDVVVQHRSNWRQIVLPRLRSFVDAVYEIRSNRDKRYRLLTSVSAPTGGMHDAWNLLHEHCPWLLECDTAYHRTCDY